MKADDSKLFEKNYFYSLLNSNEPKKIYDSLQEISKEDKEFLLYSRINKIESHLNRISKNVVFFFWIVLLNLIGGIILAFIILEKVDSFISSMSNY